MYTTKNRYQAVFAVFLDEQFATCTPKIEFSNIVITGVIDVKCMQDLLHETPYLRVMLR